MFSILLVSHDDLNAIKADSKFGARVHDAIVRHYTSENARVYGPHYAVQIVGASFQDNDMRIVVAEGNTAWMANWTEKPAWSSLTKEQAERMLFGYPKPKEKKKK